MTVRFGASDSDGAEARPTDRALLAAVVAPLLSQETYPDVSFTLAVKSGAVHVELMLAGHGTPDAVLQAQFSTPRTAPRSALQHHLSTTSAPPVQAQVQNSSLMRAALSEVLSTAVDFAVVVSPYVAPPTAPPPPLPPSPPPPPPPLYAWPACADSTAINYAPGNQVHSIHRALHISAHIALFILHHTVHP